MRGYIERPVALWHGGDVVDRTIGSVMNRPTFSPLDSAFRAALKTRVASYFASAGKHRYADHRMVLKSVVFLGALFGLYASLVLGLVGPWGALLECVALGVTVAGVGFNVAHDAIHGSYSSNRWVNRVFSALFDAFGASSYNWSRAHNVVRHTFTNVPGIDHDLEPGPFLVLQPRAKPAFIYRFQHVFAFPLYAFTMLVWVFKKDFVQIADRGMTGAAASGRGVVSLVLGKLLHFGLFMALPLAVSPYAWWQVLVGYVTTLAVTGFTLAVVFQLAHVVEGPAFPLAVGGRLSDGWASHQLRTTANFSQRSRLAAFLFGGLNHQIEHHLLPGVCHIHYPALAPMVRELAHEYGLPYHDSGNFAQALAAHVRTLHRLGRPSLAPSPS